MRHTRGATNHGTDLTWGIAIHIDRRPKLRYRMAHIHICLAAPAPTSWATGGKEALISMPTPPTPPPPHPAVATGVPGLDEVLCGGFRSSGMYLVEGDSGTGKTTLALQFLREGARRGEPALFISLSETAAELRDSAASHGWTLDGIEVCELVAAAPELAGASRYTIFEPAEVELGATLKQLGAAIERVQPVRVVIDSLVELRLLANDPLRYRRDLVALKQLLARLRATSLLADIPGADTASDGHTLVHGILGLQHHPPEYGEDHRQLRVLKFRGARVRGGWHNYSIRTGGIEVYPRLVAAEHHAPFAAAPVPSGLPALDRLLGGGLPAGSSTLLVGPSGSGKSILATQYVAAAAARGVASAFFTFDEVVGTVRQRAQALGADLTPHLATGRVLLQQVDPTELSPGEFSHLVRRAVEERHVKILVVDSLNGYTHAMADPRTLTAQLHELLTYLNQQGVLTFLVVGETGALGTGPTPVQASYLADNVLLFRFFEAAGRVYRAISVLKKRSGPHEMSIRELRLESGQIQVGEALAQFQGVLTGTPQYLGGPEALGPGATP